MNRIRFLAVAAIALALFVGTRTSAQAPPSPTARAPLKLADIEKMVNELSNWGRWGRDDQRGTVNLITPAKRRQATALVKEGLSVSMSHNPSTEKSIDNPNPFELTMTVRPGAPVALDQWRVSHHGFTFTHLDALCHWFFNGKMYNGVDASEVTEKGCAKHGIEQYKDGLLSRGVLIDIPRLKGVAYLEPGTPIDAGDIEAWEKRARVTIGPGDIVLVRTGRWARRTAVGPFSIQGQSAGLHISAVPLLKARDIAVIGSDVGLDVTPAGVEGVTNPVHTVLMVAMGVPIIDNADLEALAETAARLDRWEFMFSAAPIPVTGATGSLMNAIATF